MSSPTIEDREINDDLKKLGVVNFKKQGQTTLLLLWKSNKDNNNNKNTAAVIFPISKDGPYDTLVNFENASRGKLERKIIEEIKAVLSQDNKYLEFLLYEDGNREVNENGHAAVRGEDAQIALELVGQHCSELFLDQFGMPYAVVKIGEHIETLPLKSSRFKNWLCKTYYESENTVLNSENITSVLNILKARAEFGGIRKDLHLRVAFGRPNKEELDAPTTTTTDDDTTIHYDLTNKECQAVKISADNGWSIEQAPIIFRRYGNSQQSQVYPSKQYPPDIFDRFMKLINVKDKQDNKLLIKCYIITLFYPGIPHPALMLHGEQGSAKSTSEELIKMLVDPSPLKTVSFTRDISQLVQKLMHNYVCYFDNISKIPDEISDELCRAVTGSGFSKRELYTDDDDIIYNFKRCIGLSGVNLAATKPDLLDRGIIGEFELIPKENKRRLRKYGKSLIG